jgi:serine/threonine protein kinase/formylglycine-generating enzyme required for sulfatase activity
MTTAHHNAPPAAANSPWSRILTMGRAATTRGWVSAEALLTKLQAVDPSAPGLSAETFWVECGLLNAEQCEALLRDCFPDEDFQTIGQDATMVFRATPSPANAANGPTSGSTHSLADIASGNTGENSDLSSVAALPPSGDFISDFPTHQRGNDTNRRTSSGTQAADLWLGHLLESASDPSNSGAWPRAWNHRYDLQEEVGRGGAGRVLRVQDKALQRIVAMKILRTPGEGEARLARVERFLQEARATGRLEHPNIIPIYDVGVLPTGDVYYTMKFVQRHSLREVIRQLTADDEKMRREYSLTALLQVFLPVCQAVHYAHARGIVHRDLKPDNIMLGGYGEVLVTDWGLARLLEQPAEDLQNGQGPQTLGTPAYMSPEQAMGMLGQVDELSDIYSLGAILYEMLTLLPPHEGPSAQAVIESVARGHVVAPRRRAPGRHIPEDLEAVCTKALSAERRQRFDSAKALHDAVLRFLDGMQLREAERKVYLGRSSSREYFACLSEMERMSDEVHRLRARLEDWQPVVVKKPLWMLEDNIQRTRSRMGRAYSDAVRAYTQALAYDRNAAEAHRGLVELYWSRFEIAEREGAVADQVHYESLIRQLDTDGQYTSLLEGDGSLTLLTEEPGAQVLLYRMREFNRVLTPSEPINCGLSPVHVERLPMGSYLAVIEQGHTKTRYPVWIKRSVHWRGQVRRVQDIPEGFVHVPAGEFIAGGDPHIQDAGPARAVYLEDFLIATLPVTFGEYLAFLNDLQTHDPDQAERRAPSARGKDGELAILVNNRWEPRCEILIEGEARRRYPSGEGHEWNLPIVCVSVEDALAYIDWRSARDGLRYRLPHEWEREKAGRGVDARYFPWGNTFDATFCKMSTSRPETSQPEPVGAFEADVSIYGVRDLAGSIQEWCRDTRWQHPDGELPPESCIVRGGSWVHLRAACHLANRNETISIGRSSSLGFRLALDLDPQGHPLRFSPPDKAQS